MANQMGDASEGRAAGKGKPLNSISINNPNQLKPGLRMN